MCIRDSFSLDGTGISNISASLDDYSTGSGATLNGATVTGNTHTVSCCLCSPAEIMSIPNTSFWMGAKII